MGTENKPGPGIVGQVEADPGYAGVFEGVPEGVDDGLHALFAVAVRVEFGCDSLIVAWQHKPMIPRERSAGNPNR